MDFERRTFEATRVLNLVETRGWQETSRRLEGDKIFVSVRKSTEGVEARERRMCLDDLAMIVRVFGWSFESSGIDETSCYATMMKVLESEPVSAEGD